MQTKFSSIIFSDSKQTCDLLKSYLESFDCIENVFIGNSYDDVEVKDSIVIVDITQNLDFDFVYKISSNHDKCKIIVLAEEPSVDLIMKSMRAGAKEFLPFPVIKSELLDSVQRLMCANVSENNSKCKIISIFSNKGGIGKTSISTNLALELANITKEKVALLDLNFQLGDVTTFMNLSPTLNISNLLLNLDKVNEEFLLGTLEKYKNTSLYVLADPPVLKQEEKISSEQISKLLEILKKTFSYVVIDAESSFNAKNIAALTLSDFIFIVTVANMPALRNTQRCLNLFDKLGFQSAHILLNRFMENDDVSEFDVEKVLDKKIYWKIPNNYFTIMSAINKGVPVCEANIDSNVAKSYRDLALKISDNVYRDALLKKFNNVLGGNNGIKR